MLIPNIKEFNIEEIKKDMECVPFGNSQFQIEFMSANQETPERKFRHVLLQMNQKLNTLQSCKYNRERLEIDIKELEAKTKMQKGFELARTEVDLKEKKWALDNEVKLINDAVIEVAKYYDIYTKLKEFLPEFTRDKFELAELKYWRARLTKEASREAACLGRVEVGTLEQLDNVGVLVGRTDRGGITFSTKDSLPIGE